MCNWSPQRDGGGNKKNIWKTNGQKFSKVGKIYKHTDPRSSVKPK